MSVGATVSVDAKDTIKALRRLDKEAAKEFRDGIKGVVAPMVADAKSAYPSMPLSGMSRAWAGKFPWAQSAVQRGVKVKTSTRRGASSVVYVTQATPAGAIYELAGTGNTFGRNLRARNPKVLWPAYDRHAAQIQSGIGDLMHRAEQTVNELVK